MDIQDLKRATREAAKTVQWRAPGVPEVFPKDDICCMFPSWVHQVSRFFCDCDGDLLSQVKKSPCRKRSPAKGVWQKSDKQKSDKSVRKSDRKVTESVPKTKKSDRTPFAALLLRHPEKKFTANSSTPTPVFRPSREETQTMVREKLGPKLRPPQTLYLLGKVRVFLG